VQAHFQHGFASGNALVIYYLTLFEPMA